ncbi:hypothetical protein [Pendulispora albinea]|uniref:Adhesin n=1 Tax=Pendulispora albinea TaxID=2741071 RepID=A0ABZ2M7D5_9BACT
MKKHYAIPALAMLSMVTAIGASSSARAAAAGGTAQVTIDSAQYNFVATVCDYTGRGAQLQATLPDGTKLTVNGPSDYITIAGASVNFNGWIENVKGDAHQFVLAGAEDGGPRRFFISATCQN